MGAATDTQEYHARGSQIRSLWSQGMTDVDLHITTSNHPQFADLSEYGYGVAFLSESKYGYSCQGNVLRLSLLRAATAPDAEQDQGTQCFHLCCMRKWLTHLLMDV